MKSANLYFDFLPSKMIWNDGDARGLHLVRLLPLPAEIPPPFLRINSYFYQSKLIHFLQPYLVKAGQLAIEYLKGRALLKQTNPELFNQEEPEKKKRTKKDGTQRKPRAPTG